MSGSIEEIPLPDLIQLLSTSRKSGVLFVRTDHAAGRLFLRKGQIYFANLENNASVSSRKAIIRMLSWAQGIVRAGAARRVATGRRDGRVDRGAADGRHAPARRVPGPAGEAAAALRLLTVPRPMEPKLRDLTPEELDVFQAVLEVDTISALFDKSSLTDLALAEKLRALIDKGYVSSPATISASRNRVRRAPKSSGSRLRWRPDSSMARPPRFRRADGVRRVQARRPRRRCSPGRSGTGPAA